MKLSKNLEKMFNEQIQKELESAYIYKGMESYFAELGINGFTHFMKHQAAEEVEHAEAFMNFVREVDGHVVLDALNTPAVDYGSILEVFEKAYEHEQFISKSIDDLLTVAIEEKHYGAENFLRKFVTEQIEEEDTFRGIVDLFKFAGDDKAAIMKINDMLAQR